MKVQEWQTREYAAIHRWILNNYGKARRCVNKKCPHQCARFHWALKRGEMYARDISRFEELCADCHLKRNDCNSRMVNISNSFQYAGARARLYPSTYKKIAAIARKRRTSIAQVIAEKFSRS